VTDQPKEIWAEPLAEGSHGGMYWINGPFKDRVHYIEVTPKLAKLLKAVENFSKPGSKETYKPLGDAVLYYAIDYGINK
jgi:hypothetical protein